MSAMSSVIEEVILSFIIDDKRFLPRKDKMDWVLIALSSLLGGSGFIMLIIAVERFLAHRYQPDISALLLAGALFIATFLMISVISRRADKRNMAAATTAKAELRRCIHSLIEDICIALDEPIQDNPKLAALLTAFAGFMIARQRA